MRGWLAVAAVLCACEAAPAAGIPCARASDCPVPLVCAFGRCRTECVENRDCPLGAECLLSAPGVGACALLTQDHCDLVSIPCASGLVCAGTTCRQPCDVLPCATGGTCTPLDEADVCIAEGTDAGVLRDAMGPATDAASDAGPSCAGGTCAGIVVISELTVTGPGGARDEMIELYNRSASVTATLAHCTVYQTNTMTGERLPIGSVTATIPPHRYYLLGGQAYARSVPADGSFRSLELVPTYGSVSIECSGATVDLIAWGSTVRSEGTPISTPFTDETVQSYERKASATSTTASMASGGADAMAGNGEDTDDNESDFVVRDAADPQNAASPAEP